MTVNLQQLDGNLTGACALFLRKKNALSYFTINSTHFLWSFAIIFVVIIFKLYTVPFINNLSENPVNSSQMILISRLLVGSILWPLMAYLVCKILLLDKNFIQYITVDNWSGAVTVVITTLPIILFQLGLPLEITMMLLIFSTLIVLNYKWRIARVALATTGRNAGIMVFINIGSTAVINFIFLT